MMTVPGALERGNRIDGRNDWDIYSYDDAEAEVRDRTGARDAYGIKIDGLPSGIAEKADSVAEEDRGDEDEDFVHEPSA